MVLAFFGTGISFSQQHFSGFVKDAITKEPLPFATIILSTGIGDITDTQGAFVISSKDTITHFTISYVGYQTQKIEVLPSSKFFRVFMNPSNENLNEVIVKAKENPALEIIRKTIANKDKNYIEKALSSFKYKAYNKLLVTANADSIRGTIDSVFSIKNGKKAFVKLDSSNYEFKKQIDRHHLYITEKISEFTFEKGKNKKELVLASRMAGFKNPIYELFALNLEGYSFYEDTYTLLGNNYINPLAKNAFTNYNYKLLDTVNDNGHPAYMVYFKAKKIKKTAGLEGVLYINTDSYAIERGIGELKGIVNVKAVQDFKFLPEYNIWFPVETTLSIHKGNNNEDVSFFEGMVNFSQDTQKDSLVNTRIKDPSDVSYMLSKTNNFDIAVNIPVSVHKDAAIIEFDEDAANRDEIFWKRYRIDSISLRGIQTYKVIDSLAEAEKIEKKLNIARKVLKGYYPTPYFDFNLSQLVNFNNYEGFRLGAGGLTNSRFSKKVRLEAYGAYGFKDKAPKYHFASYFRLNKKNRTWIGIGYTDDLQEASKLVFLLEDTSFSLINPRNLNISQFINTKKYDLNFSNDIFPNLVSKFRFETGQYIPKFDYKFIGSKTVVDYNLTTAILTLQWTPFSKYMNSPIGKFAIKRGYPKITLQVTKSFDNLLNGDFDFTQLNFRAEHTVKAFNKSSTSFLIQGGIVTGNVPISHLYNGFPNYTFKEPWVKRVNFSGTNAFETMRFNEFLSDRYISIQARHNFDRFKISPKFGPALSLITRFAIGTIENPERQKGFSFNKMNKGYFESGFVVNYLFRGFGLGTFYRYGTYSNSSFSDNLAVKLTYVLSLGF